MLLLLSGEQPLNFSYSNYKLFAAEPTSSTGKVVYASANASRDPRYTLNAYAGTQVGPTAANVGALFASRVVVTKVTGAEVFEASEFKITSNAVKELNEKGNSFGFALKVTDPNINNINPPYNEVKYFKGNKLIWEGVILSRKLSSDGNWIEYTCKGLWWYTGKRNYARTPKFNFIRNASFQEGIRHWKMKGGVGVQFISEPRMSSENTDKRAVRLTAATNGVGRSMDSFIAQEFRWVVPELRKEDVITLTAWCYIPQEQRTNFVAPFDERGLFLEARSTQHSSSNPTDFSAGRKTVIDFAFTQINKDSPFGKWIRMQTTLNLKTQYGLFFGVDDNVRAVPIALNMRLYGNPAGIIWDEVSMTWNERVIYRSQDQADIIRDAVNAMQDEELGKSSLRLQPYIRPTGVKRTKTYEFINREKFSDVFEEFMRYERGVDMEIFSANGSRYFITHYPHKGQYKRRYVLMTGKNVKRVDLEQSGENRANQIIVRSGNDDAGREEGVYSKQGSTTSPDGGLVLEETYDATPGSAVTSLDDQAARGGKRFGPSYDILRLVCYSEFALELWDNLQEGDTVPVDVHYYEIHATGRFRIIRRELDDRTGEVTFDLMPVEFAYDAGVV